MKYNGSDFFFQVLDTQIGEFWAGISCHSESVERQGQKQRETWALLGEGQGTGVIPSAFLPLLVINPFPYPWLCEGKSRPFNFPKSSVTYAILQKPSPHCYRTSQSIQATFTDISNAHSPCHCPLAPEAPVGTACSEPCSVPKPTPLELAESTGELPLWYKGVEPVRS